ncbi:MAG: double-cubane-cluster-containing anaerobic reductase [Candidatus Helarchaeota archaeon]
MVEIVDHHPMWKKLGIDLEKHDQLLEILPNLYKEIYIDAQKYRPKAMDFFEFVVSDIHGIRVKEIMEAKEKGRKVIGTFCLYVPDELIIALNAISIGLCGGTNFSNYASEELLPSNTCPLIKSALGFGVGNICPYYQLVDLLVGETTCDGKKKCWEIQEQFKSTYVVETPQCKNRLQAKEHWKYELYALIGKLEDLTGNKLTFENLKAAMEKIQEKRNQLRRLYETRKSDPVPISGKDALLVSQIAFYDDPDRQIQMIKKLADELEQRIKDGFGVIKKGTKRLIISGTPMAIPNWKLHHVIETSGAIVVAEETCTGTRYFDAILEITGKNIDELVQNLADRYMQINCACFTPNENRFDDIKKLVREYKADGVILYSLQFCQPYLMENLGLEKKLKEIGILTMSIETDYASEDVEQIKTRVQAFLEMLKK